MTEALGLTVLVPAYREGPRIHDNLQLLLSELEKIPLAYEVIVVCDGEVDQTIAEIERLGSASVRTLAYPVNMGKGFALKHGFKESRGELVVFIDADMELHPSSIREFLRLIQAENADIVIGSKRHPGSRVDYPVTRRLLSLAYQLLVRVLFNLEVRDTQTGIKLFRREVLSRTFPLLLVKQFAFDLELLAVARHLGFKKIVEAPIVLDYKFGSTIGAWGAYKALWDTAAVFYRLRILRYYDREISRTESSADRVAGEERTV